MHCRQFVIIIICDASRSWSAQEMSFVDPARPASLRSTQVLGAFRLFPIANRDNRSFTDVSQCHARNTEDLVA